MSVLARWRQAKEDLPMAITKVWECYTEMCSIISERTLGQRYARTQLDLGEVCCFSFGKDDFLVTIENEKQQLRTFNFTSDGRIFGFGGHKEVEGYHFSCSISQMEFLLHCLMSVTSGALLNAWECYEENR